MINQINLGRIFVNAIIKIMIVFSLIGSAFASNTPKNLAEQIIIVKHYLKTIEHPRLILGASNTRSESIFFKRDISQRIIDLDPSLLSSITPGVYPFLDNSNDILLDHDQKPGVLVERTLTGSFNDLNVLHKLADAFANSFDVITTDYSVTKFADWTKEHLLAFKKMLKPGGKLIFPMDSGHGVRIKADTAHELFERISRKYKLSTQNSFMVNGKWYFMNLPKDIELKIGSDISTLQKLETYRQKTHKASSELSEEFMEQYVIPKNIKRLAGEVFDPNKITVQKNMDMPQPFRNKVYAGYSFSATK